ncbi:hypothetical protein Hanom_Chr02g00146971 [Helianthus anomalus]
MMIPSCQTCDLMVGFSMYTRGGSDGLHSKHNLIVTAFPSFIYHHLPHESLTSSFLISKTPYLSQSFFTMNHKDRSTILSIMSPEELQAYISNYRIPLELNPCLPGPSEPATYSSKHMVIYTPSFSFYGVHYRLSPLKMELFKHYRVHFSQIHHLAFLRIVDFELNCVAFAGAPLESLFGSYTFYELMVISSHLRVEKQVHLMLSF